MKVLFLVAALIAAASAQGGGGCMERGQCVGDFTASLPVELITDCYDVCQDDAECAAFSYNYGTLECQTYAECEEVKLVTNKS